MTFSIIIPARNAARDLEHLLNALLPQLRAGDECVLVDDASTDATLALAAKYPVRIVALKDRSGPAAARNSGAAMARGEALLFLDADVVPHADVLERIDAHLNADPELAALFGSYNDTPHSRATVSRFRNLLHCYTHRTGSRQAFTFWAGCGAIRKEIFHRLGGFDHRRFPYPSIEDIELGLRLRRAGARILLDPDLQVQHRKVWRLQSMLRTDVWGRAVPWSELILESKHAPGDLNLKPSQRYSAAASVAALAILPVFVWEPLAALSTVAILVGSIVFANWGFYRFLSRCGGWGFALRSVPLHLLYFLSGAFGFAITVVRSRWRK